MLKEEYTGSLSVTLIEGYGDYYKEARRLCRRLGWRYVKEVRVAGSEDQCVVLVRSRANAYLELLSRGKNLLVVVTTRGDR